MGENDTAVVSQVDQIGEILSDYVPTESAKVEPAKPGEPAKPVEPVKPAEPVVESAKVESAKDEGKDETVAALVEQVKALTAKITELSAKPAEPAKPVEPAKPPEPAPSPFGYFKDKKEYEAAFEKPEVMSEVMERVAAKARVGAVQDVLKTLPQVINNTIKEIGRAHV